MGKEVGDSGKLGRQIVPGVECDSDE